VQNTCDDAGGGLGLGHVSSFVVLGYLNCHSL
jgi:hypothetical protein